MLAAAGGSAALLRRLDTSESSPMGAAELAELLPELPSIPTPTRAERYQPDLDRVYSRSHYADLVVAAAPYKAMAKRAEQAITAVELRAIELDVFANDTYERKGDLVLLGERDGMWIGFTHRYTVDMRYPSNALNRDGFGSAEWGRHSLLLGDEAYELRPLRRHERPRSIDDRIAWEPIAEHDAAILYIPKSAAAFARLPSLEIPQPVQAAREAMRESSTIFGLDYVLLSPQAFDALREGVAASQRLPLGIFLAGLALGALFFAPLLGQWAAGTAISSSSLAQIGRTVLAKGLPVAVRLAGKALLDARGVLGDDGQARGLLGVEWPEDPEAQAMIGTFFEHVLAEGEGQFVAYEGPGVRGGQLFVPGRRMSVNAELLSRGLARLDLSRIEALREHPELTDAALEALDARRNLAQEWAEDDAYPRMLAMLQRG